MWCLTAVTLPDVIEAIITAVGSFGNGLRRHQPAALTRVIRPAVACPVPSSEVREYEESEEQKGQRLSCRVALHCREMD